MELTERQKEALETGRHVTLRAGAGSGKTKVLTDRYISILEKGFAEVSEILAITFTEKAANQMRKKIRGKVAERIGNHLKDGNREKVSLWEKIYEELPDARISTIHSFCASLIRDNPVAAGVDPEFVVMDENVGALKLEEAIEAALDYASEHCVADIDKLPEDWGRRKVGDALRGLLSMGVAARKWADEYSAMSVSEMLDRQREAAEAYLRTAILIEWIEEKLAVVGALSCLDQTDKQCEYVEATMRWLNDLKSAWTKKLIDVDASAVTQMKFNVGRKSAWAEGDLEAWKEMGKGLRDRAVELDAFRFTATDEKHAESCGALARLMRIATEEYSRRRGDGKLVGFDELQERALDCLEKHPETAAGSGYKFIMVDEFQDTNPMQWRLVKALAGDGKGGFRNNVFIVGDEKQSIYGFRGADVKVFGAASKELSASQDGAETGINVLLDANFRSHPRLVEFFNLLFMNVFESNPGAAGPGNIVCEYIEAKRTDADSDKKVEIICVSKDEAEEYGGERAMEAELVARRLDEMLRSGMAIPDEGGGTRPLRPEDIAVLFRKTTHVKTYEEAFRKYGLPFLNLGGYGFFESVEINDIMNILKFLSDPRDDISLVGALRGPMFGLSDESLLNISRSKGDGFYGKLKSFANEDAAEEVEKLARDRLRDWTMGAGRVKATELISRILDETGAWGIYGAGERGDQALLNIEKLIGIGAGFEQTGGGIGPFMKWFRLRNQIGAKESEAQVTGEDGCGVRFMTVHKAKGLEFPVVVVQNASFDYHKSGGFNFVHTAEMRNGKMEAAFSVWDDDGKGGAAKRNPVMCAVIKGEERGAVAREEKRLLYVACTRAMERLIIAGCDSGLRDGSLEMGDSPKTWTEEIFAALKNKEVCERFDEMVEWVAAPEKLNADAVRAVKPRVNIQKLLDGFENPAALDPAKKDVAKYLRRLPDGKMPTTITATELSAYANAEGEESKMRDFVKTYIYGVPASWSPYEKSGAAHKHHAAISPLVRGEAVHRLFEELHSIPESLIGKRLQEMLLELNVSPGREMSELVKKHAASARKFIKSEIGIAASGKSAVREVPFSLMAGSHTIVGKIDLLIGNSDGMWKVVDYKTNMIRGGGENEALDDYRTQLEVYALTVLRANAATSVSAALFFTETSGFSDSIVVDAASAEKKLAELEDKINKIADMKMKRWSM